MGLFKRKKEVVNEGNLPELPELPELPDFPDLTSSLQESEIPDVPAGLPKIESYTLPTLPNSETWDRFNQEAIKEAVYPSEPDYGLPKLKTISPKKDIEEKRTLELFSPTYMTKKMTKKLEPVFIRLDKFQMTLKTFEEIKNKIEEIEYLLKKTKEIKIKEEQELAEWEREMQIIKSRIDTIDKSIFNKLD